MASVIHLNGRENQLRHLLLDVSKFISETGVVERPVELRWAGGWVRDKLLGAESHDIDVAVNAMTGAHFAERMRAYCCTEEAMRKHSMKPEDMGSLHNVARNPEKSKHLETAMLRVFGLELDLVNLRKETYADDSRNPTVEFGTPEEDAFRRDATINALFYNLHTMRVEDFTGGLQDMDAKVVRTPLDPLETFKDDPLRVLRLVRFASRLDFSIDIRTRQVMAHKQVLDALKIKISRERVGTELEKMLKGSRPSAALELIDKLRLYHAIFTYPMASSAPDLNVSRWHVAYRCLASLLQNRSPGSLGHLLVRSDEATYIAWNLAALGPWMTVDPLSDGVRKPSALPPVALVGREGYKTPSKLTKLITASYKNRREIQELKAAASGQRSKTHTRVTLGMAIRRWDSQGGAWTLQVLNALLVEAMEILQEWTEIGGKVQNDFVDGWVQFLDQIVDLDVYDAPGLKNLLDGRSLSQALGVPPGRWTGKALEVCVEWQFRNPQETDPAGAIEEIRSRRQQLGIPELPM